jgi:putative addiction module killer protein
MKRLFSEDEYSLRYDVAANGKRPFAKWLLYLPDRDGAARVQVRLERLRLGNFGDVRSLGKGLSELRVDVGPGYRAYFTTESKSVVMLFCAGDKAAQQRDINRAREYLADYRRRSDA